ncbi:MAG: phosphatidylglycerophosphatase A [Pseudomonadota bacterium]
MLAKYIATWFGSGLIPKAPGTWGTLAAIPFAFVIIGSAGPFALLIAAIIAFIIGVWAAGAYATTTGKPDPSDVVIDEVAAIWLVLAFVPVSFVGWFIAFAVFRFFDVVKPWPVSLADAKLKGGFGIMADDIIAALYTLLILWLMQFYLGA